MSGDIRRVAARRERQLTRGQMLHVLRTGIGEAGVGCHRYQIARGVHGVISVNVALH